MKRPRLRLAGVLLLISIFFWSGMDARAAGTDQIEKDIRQKKKDLRAVHKELSRTKEKEKKIKGTEISVLDSLNAIEIQLNRKEKELKEMQARVDELGVRLEQTRGQILSTRKEMERAKGELYSRLKALYRMERVPQESFFLSSESYVDLLRTDKYLRVLIQSDRRLADEYRAQAARMSRHHEALTRDQSQWQRNIFDLETKKREIKKAREAKRVLLDSVREEKVGYQKLIAELEERSKGLQSLINKLEREKSVFAYGKSKHEPPSGRLPPPVQGSIISLFKEKGQNGIEIKAPVGTEIRAILAGKVLYSDWFKSFGNVIIIDHGDQTFTVSAYCSRLLKKEGELVSQGEPIALVGEAGSLKGPCLYFEVRHHGKAQDPLLWISRPG